MTLNPSDIASPIRSMLRSQRNVSVVLAEAISVHVGAKRVILADGAIAYDYLIVSTGATHSYFYHDAWATHAPGLKSIEDALEIRRRVFVAYEAAERETDPGRRRDWMTFVIIGAGPTGVELAGALAEISRHALDRDFRNIDPRRARIVLVEALPRSCRRRTRRSCRRRPGGNWSASASRCGRTPASPRSTRPGSPY